MTERFVDAIRAGTLREQLEATRDYIAEAMELAPPREQAPLAGQLRQVLIDLDAMPTGKEESTVDLLAERRAARRADAAAS